MLWFDGSIRNAVEKVKISGVTLLVFVKGDDNLSEKYESCLTKETQFNPLDYVAIKILNNSVAHKQLKQIYISVPIPSIFLIGNNGIPLSVISSKETSNIYNTVNDALGKQKMILRKNNTHKETDSREDLHLKPKHKAQEELNTKKTSQYVKKVGYKLFDVSEDEIKKRLQELRSFPKFFLLEKCKETTSFSNTVSLKHSARIQFRLPNNSTESWEFPDQSTLADVRAYLLEKVDVTPNFKFLKAYPRAAFTSQDENKTLVDLSLTPSATLIVVPIQNKSVQATRLSQENFIFAAIKSIFQPLIFLYNYLLGRGNGIQEDSNSDVSVLESDPSDKMAYKKTSTSNIHGFDFNDESESESEHPDNGNSTQQRYYK